MEFLVCHIWADPMGRYQAIVAALASLLHTEAAFLDFGGFQSEIIYHCAVTVLYFGVFHYQLCFGVVLAAEMALFLDSSSIVGGFEDSGAFQSKMIHHGSAASLDFVEFQWKGIYGAAAYLELGPFQEEVTLL